MDAVRNVFGQVLHRRLAEPLSEADATWSAVEHWNVCHLERHLEHGRGAPPQMPLLCPKTCLRYAFKRLRFFLHR